MFDEIRRRPKGSLDILLSPEQVEAGWRNIEDPDHYVVHGLERLQRTNPVLAEFLLSRSAIRLDEESEAKAGVYMQTALYTYNLMQEIPACRGRRVTENQAGRYDQAIYRMRQAGGNFYDLSIDALELVSPKLSEGLRDAVHDLVPDVKGDFLQGIIDTWNLVIFSSLEH